MTLAAGTASAGGYGDDQRCEKPKGVVVVCTSDQLVDLSDLDADVLNILDGHGHHRRPSPAAYAHGVSGQLLRKADTRHECGPPDDVGPGAVWRCECGKRWTRVALPPNPRNALRTPDARWVRRYWPWPRRPRTTMAGLASAAGMPDGYVPASASLSAPILPPPGGGAGSQGSGRIDVPPILEIHHLPPPLGVGEPHHCPGCRCGE